MAFLHLTGLLKVTTATVGIRGTVFDLACGKADATDNPPEAELTDAECNQSPFASTRAGEITLASADRREVSMPAGQVVLEQSGQTIRFFSEPYLHRLLDGWAGVDTAFVEILDVVDIILIVVVIIVIEVVVVKV